VSIIVEYESPHVIMNSAMLIAQQRSMENFGPGVLMVEQLQYKCSQTCNVHDRDAEVKACVAFMISDVKGSCKAMLPNANSLR
jgi:hypothetical protein